MSDITMPKLSDSMEQGTVLTWLVADGDHVETGADLVEIETDKATMTVQAEVSGRLEILAEEGVTLAVGEPIARVGDTARAAAPGTAPAAAANGSAVATRTPVAAVAPPADRNGSASRATPVARRAAEAHGVSLADVAGTGPLGRITRGDVLAKAGVVAEPPRPAPAPVPAPAPAAPASASASASASAKGAVEVVEPTRLQAVVARRMADAKATVPEFEVQTEVDMGQAVALRGRLKRRGRGGAGAVAQRPGGQGRGARPARPSPRERLYRDGRFELYARVNVGIAVAADDALVVPTIFDADEKGLGAIAAAARRLAERVREGSITPPELSGATFTVSNLGMYGMTAITPVVNAPQAGILGVGALREVLARDEGEIVDRTLMTLTLTCDHRILYGADAARFLAQIRAALERPLRLVL